MANADKTNSEGAGSFDWALSSIDVSELADMAGDGSDAAPASHNVTRSSANVILAEASEEIEEAPTIDAFEDPSADKPEGSSEEGIEDIAEMPTHVLEAAIEEDAVALEAFEQASEPVVNEAEDISEMSTQVIEPVAYENEDEAATSIQVLEPIAYEGEGASAMPDQASESVVIASEAEAPIVAPQPTFASESSEPAPVPQARTSGKLPSRPIIAVVCAAVILGAIAVFLLFQVGSEAPVEEKVVDEVVITPEPLEADDTESASEDAAVSEQPSDRGGAASGHAQESNRPSIAADPAPTNPDVQEEPPNTAENIIENDDGSITYEFEDGTKVTIKYDEDASSQADE